MKSLSNFESFQIENSTDVKGGFFGLLTGGLFGLCAPTYNYCAPKANYCAPTINYCAPAVNYCAPKVNYCAPKSSWWC